MRPLTDRELIVLQMHNMKEKKVIFSEEDIKALKGGDASFKIFSKAENVIEEHRKFMSRPPSREEIKKYVADLIDASLSRFHSSEVFPLTLEYVAFRDILIEKGIIAMEEISNRTNKIVADAEAERKALKETEKEKIGEINPPQEESKAGAEEPQAANAEEPIKNPE